MQISWIDPCKKIERQNEQILQKRENKEWWYQIGDCQTNCVKSWFRADFIVVILTFYGPQCGLHTNTIIWGEHFIWKYINYHLKWKEFLTKLRASIKWLGLWVQLICLHTIVCFFQCGAFCVRITFELRTKSADNHLKLHNAVNMYVICRREKKLGLIHLS